MTPSTEAEWLQLAQEAALKAYSPYSRVQVGCVLRSQSGIIYSGCNVENASYGLTICAERNAVFQAVAAEGPSLRIAELAVIAVGHEFPPCGACRQVIAEFATAGTSVLFLERGQPVRRTIAELLPSGFSGDALC
ncbi:MAG: cytidine deaminase [Verrucomicrobiales bacterium]|nr:cytidine deaminase [Verrucomicrobiales bacterium]